MSTRRKADMQTTLQRKGFRKDNTHHEMYWLFNGTRKTAIRTRLSHGISEYGQSLLGKMQKQLKLTRREFNRFMDCPMDGTEYRKLLIERGHIGS